MSLFTKTIDIKGLTQGQAVEKHLKKYKTITSIEAISKYGITRLSAHIYRLRNNGYIISSVNKSVKNRFGTNSHIAIYKLISLPEEN